MGFGRRVIGSCVHSQIFTVNYNGHQSVQGEPSDLDNQKTELSPESYHSNAKMLK